MFGARKLRQPETPRLGRCPGRCPSSAYMLRVAGVCPGHACQSAFPLLQFGVKV